MYKICIVVLMRVKSQPRTPARRRLTAVLGSAAFFTTPRSGVVRRTFVWVADRPATGGRIGGDIDIYGAFVANRDTEDFNGAETPSSEPRGKEHDAGGTSSSSRQLCFAFAPPTETTRSRSSRARSSASTACLSTAGVCPAERLATGSEEPDLVVGNDPTLGEKTIEPLETDHGLTWAAAAARRSI
jgi:hypothetical protein